MDYCVCGEQATGRCARDGAFFCVRHKRTYPRTVADLLEQAGHGPLTLPRSSGPPLQVQVRGGTWTLLCQSCFQDAIDKALPEIAKHLTNVEHGSIERMVIRLIRSAGAWRDSVNDHHPIGPDIVTAVVGHQPKWLFDNEVQTMAALYATIARARSLTPPHIEVEHLDEKRTRTAWLNKEKITRTTRHVGSLDAWAFYVRDDFDWVLLVGTEGGIAKVSSSWTPVNNIITVRHESEHSDVDKVKRLVQSGPQPWQSLDKSGCGPLITAIEPLLS